MRHIAIALSALALAGCTSGLYGYAPPGQSPRIDESRVLHGSPAAIERRLAANLPREAPHLVDIDRRDGVVNFAFDGPPGTYVDCGWIDSVVADSDGTRVYNFPGSTTAMRYELFNPQDGKLHIVIRTMTLDVRSEVTLEPFARGLTSARPHSSYVLTRRQIVDGIDITDSVNFALGQTAAFPVPFSGTPTICQSTGAFERELLDALQRADP